MSLEKLLEKLAKLEKKRKKLLSTWDNAYTSVVVHKDERHDSSLLNVTDRLCKLDHDIKMLRVVITVSATGRGISCL